MRRTNAYFRRRLEQLAGPLSAAFGTPVQLGHDSHRAQDAHNALHRLQVVADGMIHVWPTRAKHLRAAEFDAFLDGLEESLEPALRRAGLDVDRG